MASTALTAAKQIVIGNFLLKNAPRGAPLTRAQFIDGDPLFVRSLSDERQARLIFKYFGLYCVPDVALRDNTVKNGLSYDR